MVANEADVVVAGGGMGGLTAACSAQEAGARTVLLEKAPRIGGSAAASGGTIWCATDLDGWLSVQPGGDPALGRALIKSFHEGIPWLRRQGVDLEERSADTPYRFRRIIYACQPDAATAMSALADRFTAIGGTIIAETGLRDLLLDDRGAISGVRALGQAGFATVKAPAVILATGGFQGSPELRARYLGRWADQMVLRGNIYSTGDGFQAALRAGATTAGPFSRFYGHMVPAPPANVGLHNFAAVKPDFSEYAVFVNLHGERFDDEFLGDEVTVHAAAQQEQALVFLVYDEAIRARLRRSAVPTAATRGRTASNISATPAARFWRRPRCPRSPTIWRRAGVLPATGCWPPWSNTTPPPAPGTAPPCPSLNRAACCPLRRRRSLRCVACRASPSPMAAPV